MPPLDRPKVFIESPFAGNVPLNVRYLRACLADSLRRGEAPYASHAIYTQPGVLRDEVPEEREAGLEAGDAWRQESDLVVVYQDLGISPGMRAGIARAAELGIEVGYRTLGSEWHLTIPAGFRGEFPPLDPCPGCGSVECAGCTGCG